MNLIKNTPIKFFLGVIFGAAITSMSLIGLLANSSSMIEIEYIGFPPINRTTDQAIGAFRIIDNNQDPNTTNIVNSVTFMLSDEEDELINNSPDHQITVTSSYNQLNSVYMYIIPDIFGPGVTLQPGTRYYNKICAQITTATSQGTTINTYCGDIISFTTFTLGSNVAFDLNADNITQYSVDLTFTLIESPEALFSLAIQIDTDPNFTNPMSSYYGTDMGIGDYVQASFNNLTQGTTYYARICYTYMISNQFECSQGATFTTLDSFVSSASRQQRRRYAVVLSNGTVIKSLSPINYQQNQTDQDPDIEPQPQQSAKTLSAYTVNGSSITFTGEYNTYCPSAYYMFAYGTSPYSLVNTTKIRQAKSTSEVVYETVNLEPGYDYYYQFKLIGCGTSSSGIVKSFYLEPVISYYDEYYYEEDVQYSAPYNAPYSDSIPDYQENVFGDRSIEEQDLDIIRLSSNVQGSIGKNQEVIYRININTDPENTVFENIEFKLPEGFKFLGSTAGFYDPESNSVIIGVDTPNVGPKTIYVTAVNKSKKQEIALASVKMLVQSQGEEPKTYYAQIAHDINKASYDRLSLKYGFNQSLGANMNAIMWLVAFVLVLAIIYIIKGLIND